MTSQVEASSGPTSVTFDLYRTGPDTAPVVLTYTVVAPDSSYVEYGETLTTGTVTIGASQNSGTLTIEIPGSIGAAVEQTLEVAVSVAAPAVVIGHTAQETIINDNPVAGPAPGFGLEVSNDQALLPVQNGNDWNINLGALKEGVGFGTSTLALAVINTGGSTADTLAGVVAAHGNGCRRAGYDARRAYRNADGHAVRYKHQRLCGDPAGADDYCDRDDLSDRRRRPVRPDDQFRHRARRVGATAFADDQQ